MDIFQAALLTGACLAALVSFHLPRAWLWILLGAVSFVLSAIWQKAGLPYREGFGAATDFVIVLLIYRYAERRWELMVMNCFILMMLLDFLYITGAINSHFWLIVSLECANWLALFVITGAGITERIRDGEGVDYAVHRGVSGHLHRALHAERSVASRPRT